MATGNRKTNGRDALSHELSLLTQTFHVLSGDSRSALLASAQALLKAEASFAMQSALESWHGGPTRVKDWPLLEQAVEAKIEEQAELPSVSPAP